MQSLTVQTWSGLRRHDNDLDYGITGMRASLILLLATATLLTGCNTVRGVGQDVQSVGKAVEKSSN